MTLPLNVATTRTTVRDSFRNRVAARLANASLALATDDYRTLVHGAIKYGLDAAARDVAEGIPAPADAATYIPAARTPHHTPEAVRRP